MIACDISVFIYSYFTCYCFSEIYLLNWTELEAYQSSTVGLFFVFLDHLLENCKNHYLYRKRWFFCYWNVIITSGTTKLEKKKENSSTPYQIRSKLVKLGCMSFETIIFHSNFQSIDVFKFYVPWKMGCQACFLSYKHFKGVGFMAIPKNFPVNRIFWLIFGVMKINQEWRKLYVF